MSKPTNESATARLSRLLTMVPWLVNRQGIDIDEAAAELNVTKEQIEADLNLLFVCGTPGHMPDDLIEAEWENGRVFLRNADTIARPLRLGLDEAMTLIVGLRTLAAVPGLGERDAVERALAKLTEAAGEASDASTRVQISLDSPATAATLEQIRQALAEHRRLHLRYLVAARDEATERDVDPMRLVNLDGHWYLEAWCHRATDVRMFRLDRIDAITTLDLDGTPPPNANARELGSSIFQPGPEDTVVVLALQPQAAWVADYYPADSVQVEDDGSITMSLRTSQVTWIKNLVWRLGGAARVVSPEYLRADVCAGSASALALYEHH